jgi:tetratricopeptide (TPR) repeat protein
MVKIARLTGRKTPPVRRLASLVLAALLLPALGLRAAARDLHSADLHSNDPHSTDPHSNDAAALHSGLCAGDSAQECGVTKADFKRAQRAFEQAAAFAESYPDQALDAYDLALRLVPRNVRFLSARTLYVQRFVYAHMQRGNRLMEEHDPVAASAEFRMALELDPGNQYALERLLDATQTPLAATLVSTDPLADLEPRLRPRPGTQTIHLHTTTRGAYSSLCQAFGVAVVFDASTPSLPVNLDLETMSFERAMNTVALVTGTFWTPLSSTQVMVAADHPDKRKDFERPVQRVYYLPEVTSARELTAVADLLRKLFDISSVTESFSDLTLTVRGPAPLLAAATQFLQALWIGRPQVVLDFEVVEIAGQKIRNLGVTPPTQLTMFPLPQTSGSAELTGSSAVVTFGGGQSTIGVAAPSATANFSRNSSLSRSLSRVTMRGAQDQPTTFRLGTRYPVITSSYTGATTLGSLPGVTYEDLGISIKATPVVHGGEVTMSLDIDFSSLGAAAYNDIPVINQRKFSGTATVRNHESIIVAGAMSSTEIKSLLAVPGLGELPGVDLLTGDHQSELDANELLIVVTPHVLTASPTRAAQVVMPRGYNSNAAASAPAPAVNSTAVPPAKGPATPASATAKPATNFAASANSAASAPAANSANVGVVTTTPAASPASSPAPDPAASN